MKFSMLLVLLLLFSPADAFPDDRIGFNILNNEFKGIIIYKVEVVENLLEGRLPNEKELLSIADQLIGSRGNDPRRKLVQFVLPGMKSGVYALAEMEDGPIEIQRHSWLLADSPQYGKYVDKNYEFIE